LKEFAEFSNVPEVDDTAMMILIAQQTKELS
jgi:hypothetical protein